MFAVASNYVIPLLSKILHKCLVRKLDSPMMLKQGRQPVLLSSMIDSDRHPLTSLSKITAQFKGILKSTSFPNSQIYGRFIG